MNRQAMRAFKRQQDKLRFRSDVDRAWIFGHVRGILFGEKQAFTDSYEFFRFFPKDEAIPEGEGERASTARASAHEFFYARRIGVAEEFAKHLLGASKDAPLPSPSFWCEPLGDLTGTAWRVLYAMPAGFPLVDALVLKDRCGPRVQLFLSAKFFKLDNEE